MCTINGEASKIMYAIKFKYSDFLKLKSELIKFTHQLMVIGVVVAALIMGSLAICKPNRPLMAILSYEDFTALIINNSKRVPDLQKLWDWTSRTGQNDVYWAGGTLRGFLHWHFLQLQNHSLEEVQRMPVPSITDLQLLGGKDVDFVGPFSAEVDATKALKNVAELDFIDSDTYAEYSKCGGPTIEKIGINPQKIMDPYQGFRHYYEGKIVFHWTDEIEFRNFPWIQDGDFSKTTEALRFLRFGYYNLPELTPDPASIAMIQSISDFEIPFLRQQDRLIWAGKALKKLIMSANYNVPEVIALLQEYHLTPVLIDAISNIPLDTPEIRAWSLDATHLEIETFLSQLKSPPSYHKNARMCSSLFVP